MSCPEIDIKAYLLEELDESGRRQAREHLSGCAACREELQRLEVARAALLTLPREEMPRRIAFVSDKVFELNWWQRLWQSGPRLVFASSAMLSAALIWTGLAVSRPAPAPLASQSGGAAIEALVEERVQEEVERRVGAAVRQAVTESEDQMRKQTAALLEAAEQRMALERRADLLQVEENFQVLRKRMNILLTASADLGASQ